MHYSKLPLVRSIIYLYLQLSFAQFVYMNLPAVLLKALIKIRWRNRPTEPEKLSSSSHDMLNKQQVNISTPEVIRSYVQSVTDRPSHSLQLDFRSVSIMHYKLHLHMQSILQMSRKWKREWKRISRARKFSFFFKLLLREIHLRRQNSITAWVRKCQLFMKANFKPVGRKE